MNMISRWFETVRDIHRDSQTIARRAYGVVEIIDGKFEAVRLRPFPTMISSVEAAWFGRYQQRCGLSNGCRLYYNQPAGHRSYLALVYVVTTLNATLTTLRLGLKLIDEIARIKRCDAILCQVTNRRLTDRILGRAGWERHLLHRRGRHFIRRFYGQYPAALEQSPIAVTITAPTQR
jgi:hypothetical protein